MSVEEKAEKGIAIKDTSTGYAFTRLGEALFEIASCVVGDCAPAETEEGGDAACSANDLPAVTKSSTKKNKKREE